MGQIDQISNEIGKLQAQVGHLQSMLGNADERAAEHRKEIIRKLDQIEKKHAEVQAEHQKRIDALEGFRNNAMVVVTVVAGIASVAWTALGGFVTRLFDKVSG